METVYLIRKLYVEYIKDSRNPVIKRPVKNGQKVSINISLKKINK